MEVLLSDRKQWPADILNGIDKFQKDYAKWKRPDTKHCMVLSRWNSRAGKTTVADQWFLMPGEGDWWEMRTRELFNVLYAIRVVVTQLHVFVKTHWILHLKLASFVVYK